MSASVSVFCQCVFSLYLEHFLADFDSVFLREFSMSTSNNIQLKSFQNLDVCPPVCLFLSVCFFSISPTFLDRFWFCFHKGVQYGPFLQHTTKISPNYRFLSTSVSVFVSVFFSSISRIFLDRFWFCFRDGVQYEPL